MVYYQEDKKNAQESLLEYKESKSDEKERAKSNKKDREGTRQAV